MGDQRTYQRVVVVRLVQSVDGMTANWFPASPALLARISTRIVNEVRGVNRVVYDVTTKPPGHDRVGITCPGRSSTSTTTANTASSTAPSGSATSSTPPPGTQMPAVALTDHGNIFGAVQFFKEAAKKGVKPILGCEVYVAPKSRLEKKARFPRAGPFPSRPPRPGRNRLPEPLPPPVAAYLEGFYYRPRIDKEILAQNAKGLIGLSSCLKGEVAFLLGRGMDEGAEGAAAAYADILGRGHFYIELQDHGLEQQKETNPKLVALARRLGLPLVATNDVHYHRREDAESHDVLLCIQTNKKLSRPGPDPLRDAGILFQVGRGNGPACSPKSPRRSKTRPTSPPSATSAFPTGAYFLPQFTPPDGKSLKEYFEETVRSGIPRSGWPLLREKFGQRASLPPARGI